MRRILGLTCCLFVAAGCASSGKAPIGVNKDGETIVAEPATGVTLKPTTTTVAPTTTTIPQVVIPNLANYDKDVALATLSGLGLLAELEPIESREEPGSVVSVKPNAGVAVDTGSVVTVKYAVPYLHEVTVDYIVEQPTWLNGTPGDGPCEHRDYEVTEGQTVLLIGPSGEILGASPVINGGPGFHPEFRRPCVFEFVFKDIPEVASYEFETPDGTRFPAYSLSDARSNGWTLGWEVNYSWR